MSKARSINLRILALAVPLTALVACATTPQSDSVAKAEKAYNEALSIVKPEHEEANEFLSLSQEALHKAEHRGLSSDENISAAESAADVEHLAYVAEKNAETAIALSRKAQGADQLAQLNLDLEAAKLAQAEREAQKMAAANAASESDSKKELAAALANAQSAGAKVETRGDSIAVSFENVNFETAKAEIPSSFESTLKGIAGALSKRPEAKVVISGHTDSTGPQGLNMNLSTMRALSVKTFLVNEGLSRDRVDTEGLGPTKPIASNDTPQGRAMNRRVEIVISGAESE